MRSWKLCKIYRKTRCARVSFLIKLLFKKRLSHRCFPVNFAKFSWTPFFKEHLQWLLLTKRKIHKLLTFTQITLHLKKKSKEISWSHAFLTLVAASVNFGFIFWTCWLATWRWLKYIHTSTFSNNLLSHSDTPCW